MSTLLGLIGLGDATLGGGVGGDSILKLRRNSRGFTLVELLVVIAIISILATLLLLQLGIARAKARDAKRIADINQVRSAAELYFDDVGSYPATNTMTLLEPTYLINVPHDPLSQTCTDTYNGVVPVGSSWPCYGYAWNVLAGPRSFHIWAELEQRNTNAFNADADMNSSGWAGGGTGRVDGALQTCTSGTTLDCVYDSGQP